MTTRRAAAVLALIAVFLVVPALAKERKIEDYSATIAEFQKIPDVAALFGNAHGYAVFPTIGKGGLGIGGSHGKGQVYVGGKVVGFTSTTDISVGLQAGGQAYSQIIFFQNKKAFDDFTSGNFEFSAQATAVAITAGASAQAGTSGTGAGASGTQKHATTAGGYQHGMAVFTVAKGGLMYEASIGGQKFGYKPKK